MSQSDQTTRSVGARVLSVLLRGVLPIAVVTAGVLGAAHLIKTAPEAETKSRTQAAVPVVIRPTSMTTERAIVQAMGTVIAAKEIVLQPQVSGIVQELHPSLSPGGRIAAGEELVKIESADYDVAVRQAEAAVARSEAQLQFAQFELERILGLEERQATNEKELTNARTVLAEAQANTASSRAALDKAQLDLSRTVLRAPFSCVVVDEDVDVGSFVTPQTSLATLVGTDEYWVRVAIPVEQLRWIQIPSKEDETGSLVRVTQRLGPDESSEWTGRIVRLLGDLEPQGRMARVLVSMRNPLGAPGTASEHPPLLIGSYVEVAIEGQELENVVTVSRDELHDGDTVWIMNGMDQLEIRDVEIVFRGRDHVLIRKGLKHGERVVATDLASPVPGMTLRETREETSQAETTSTDKTEMAAGEAPNRSGDTP